MCHVVSLYVKVFTGTFTISCVYRPVILMYDYANCDITSASSTYRVSFIITKYAT